MNDMMHYGWATCFQDRVSEEAFPSYDGGGYSIAHCCGARHYRNVDEFNARNQGVQTLINPSEEPIPGANYKLERVQLGKDVLIIKLRGVK